MLPQTKRAHRTMVQKSSDNSIVGSAGKQMERKKNEGSVKSSRIRAYARSRINGDAINELANGITTSVFHISTVYCIFYLYYSIMIARALYSSSARTFSLTLSNKIGDDNEK